MGSKIGGQPRGGRRVIRAGEEVLTGTIKEDDCRLLFWGVVVEENRGRQSSCGMSKGAGRMANCQVLPRPAGQERTRIGFCKSSNLHVLAKLQQGVEDLPQLRRCLAVDT